MIIAATLFVCLSFIFAGVHANVINEGRGRSLKKKAWFMLYAGIASLLAWLSGMRHEINFDWWMIANAAAIRTVFFNIPLNRMRKPPVPWFYVTPELKNVTGWGDAWRKGRFTDYALWKIFKRNQWIPYAAALAAAVYITVTK